jgi:hypothetical protein
MFPLDMLCWTFAQVQVQQQSYILLIISATRSSGGRCCNGVDPARASKGGRRGGRWNLNAPGGHVVNACVHFPLYSSAAPSGSPIH